MTMTMGKTNYPERGSCESRNLEKGDIKKELGGLIHGRRCQKNKHTAKRGVLTRSGRELLDRRAPDESFKRITSE